MTQDFAPDLRDHDDELAPEVFVIAHDDYHASHVGLTADGQQFFITTPFAWASAEGGSQEFAARYLFTPDGALAEAEILPLGPRPGLGALPGNVESFADQSLAIEHLLAQISPVVYGDITIKPFSVMAHGLEFGMVLNGPVPEDPDEEWYWSVNLEPGDFMAFSAPWDSGDYDP